jgi:hypothetical protein
MDLFSLTRSVLCGYFGAPRERRQQLAPISCLVKNLTHLVTAITKPIKTPVLQLDAS